MAPDASRFGALGIVIAEPPHDSLGAASATDTFGADL
jgi:hypothetical protein